MSNGSDLLWSLFCKEQQERIVPESDGAKSDGSNLLLGIKREKEVKNCQKHTKKTTIFQANTVFFRAICLNHECSHSSFAKIKKSNSLMVALLIRATRGICPGLLFFLRVTRENSSLSLNKINNF